MSNKEIVYEESMPVLQLIKHIEVPSQDIATVMDGIAEAMSEEKLKRAWRWSNQPKEFTASSTFAPEAWRQSFGRLPRRARDNVQGVLAADAAAKGIHSFTPIRKCIADSNWRQLFLFHDNHFCQNQTILLVDELRARLDTPRRTVNILYVLWYALASCDVARPAIISSTYFK